MTLKKRIQYLIVAEINRMGFLLELQNNYVEAELYIEHIFNLSDEFSIFEMNNVEKKLKYFASYQISGNELYLNKIKRSISNGVYTVSIVKIELNNFCLKTFIKERENHSSVFTIEKYPKQLDKLAELFPNINLVAN